MDFMEDFVTYETAKKLKEKGFIGNGDIGCKCGFYTDAYNYAYDDLDNSELMPNECLRFTISQVLTWLRKEKGIHICADICSGGWFVDITSFYKEDTGVYECNFPYLSNDDTPDYDSYEQAALTGIEYVLDNLI